MVGPNVKTRSTVFSFCQLCSRYYELGHYYYDYYCVMMRLKNDDD